MDESMAGSLMLGVYRNSQKKLNYIQALNSSTLHLLISSHWTPAVHNNSML